MKALYFFCMDTAKDQVASNVYQQLTQLIKLQPLNQEVDDMPIMYFADERDNTSYIVRTNQLLCENHNRYQPLIDQFSDVDIIGFVNWHGGEKAPDNILSVHTVGDVTQAIYPPSQPTLTTHLMRLLETHRSQLNLSTFTVTSEATHWSGVVYGLSVDDLKQVNTPLIDIEIGSSEQAYLNQTAGKAIALSLIDLFSVQHSYPTLLYIGGIHFETTISEAILRQNNPVALTHILPSCWVENDMYRGENGLLNFKRCIDSIQGGIDGIVMHEKLKGPTKATLRTLAEQLGVALIKRKELKKITDA